MVDLLKYKENLITVEDKITKFRGIITGHADYITGCDQFLVQPLSSSSSEWKEGRWFDHARLEVVETRHTTGLINHDNGADMEAPIK